MQTSETDKFTDIRGAHGAGDIVVDSHACVYILSPGIEPGTFRVLGGCDNHYTTITVVLVMHLARFVVLHGSHAVAWETKYLQVNTRRANAPSGNRTRTTRLEGGNHNH